MSNETKLQGLVSYDHVEWALCTAVWLVRRLQMKETVSKGTGYRVAAVAIRKVEVLQRGGLQGRGTRRASL